MKFIGKFFKWLFLILILLAGLGYAFLWYLQPNNEGERTLEGLTGLVEIYYDAHAVPHIYAKNEEDAYFALGFVHAQERLFQMDLLRRAGKGRLSELFGDATLGTDKFFRTVGIGRSAERNAKALLVSANAPHLKAMQAYLKGVNSYIENGKKPLEYWLINASPEPFELTDILATGGVLAIGFAEGFRTEPMVQLIKSQLGDEYLDAIALNPLRNGQRIATVGASLLPSDTTKTDSAKVETKLDSASTAMALAVNKALAQLPIPLWLGSNGWAISPKKTKNGKAILANDTHMSYSQPCVWYEAHLDYPGFRFVGLHAAGIPFGLVGRNADLAWGLTMFENDDTDFYRERVNPENPSQIWEVDHWVEMEINQESIAVKGQPEVAVRVRSTPRGPIMTDLADGTWKGEEAISLWWAFNKFEVRSLEGWYHLARAKSVEEAKKGAMLLDAPGLNVMAADAQGNIAWWACGKLFERPAHVQPKHVLDGSNGKDDQLQLLDFSANPKAENPSWNYVYSANNEPDSMAGRYIPGYYYIGHRAYDIVQELEAKNDWTEQDVMAMQFGVRSRAKAALARKICAMIPTDVRSRSEMHQQAFSELMNWTGDCGLESIAPGIFYKMEFFALKGIFADELGEDGFSRFLSTALAEHSFELLLDSTNAVWWDSKLTPAFRETAPYILGEAFDESVRTLKNQWGNDVSGWKWEKMHQLKHPHAFGMGNEWLDKIFSIMPATTVGGREVVNNVGFRLSDEAIYISHYGPAMRLVVDFSHPEYAWNVLPTGQSGYFMSPYYADQADLYNTGKFREQWLHSAKVLSNHKGKLILLPK